MAAEDEMIEVIAGNRFLAKCKQDWGPGWVWIGQGRWYAGDYGGRCFADGKQHFPMYLTDVRGSRLPSQSTMYSECRCAVLPAKEKRPAADQRKWLRGRAPRLRGVPVARTMEMTGPTSPITRS